MRDFFKTLAWMRQKVVSNVIAPIIRKLPNGGKTFVDNVNGLPRAFTDMLFNISASFNPLMGIEYFSDTLMANRDMIGDWVEDNFLSISDFSFGDIDDVFDDIGDAITGPLDELKGWLVDVFINKIVTPVRKSVFSVLVDKLVPQFMECDNPQHSEYYGGASRQ